MSFSYENQGTNTYLVYKLAEDDCIDSLGLGMLTNNKIPGLASAIFTQMNEEKYIKFNVSARVSVKQFFSGSVNKKRLIGVFSGIVDAMLSAEDYMIDVNFIVVDLDYIFADVSTCDTVMICLPICNSTPKSVDLASFFKTIMFSTQFDQTENCDHVAKIMNYLNSVPIFSLLDFKALLDSLRDANVSKAVEQKPKNAGQIAQTTPKQDNTQRQHMSSIPQPVLPPQKQKQVEPAIVPPVPHPLPMVVDNSQHTQPAQSPEKHISMLGLLMHYSKENAELYKAQKAAKKNNSGTPNSEHCENQKSHHEQTVPFSIPTASQQFAIPGQATPPIQPRSPETHGEQKLTEQPSVVQPPQSSPAFIPIQPVSGEKANFGETTVLGGGMPGETTVLTANKGPKQPLTPYLVREKTNERILLNKPVFRVGKERSYVDYFIGDNTAISRSHANFISREGAYFVVDTNSTNHTFVNGKMIQSNVETQINQGDTIRLANENFKFNLY